MKVPHCVRAFAQLISVIAVAILILGPKATQAHPHVWIENRAEVVFNDARQVTGLRIHWVFDDFYSRFTLEELDENQNGTLDGQELADLARDSIQSLSDFRYFTYINVNGIPADYASVTDYRADFRDGLLSLTFFLPLQTPVDPGKDDLRYSSYDPSYYIAIEPRASEAIRMVGASADNCGSARQVPDDPEIDTVSLPEAAFTGDFGYGEGIGSLFATTFILSCAAE